MTDKPEQQPFKVKPKSAVIDKMRALHESVHEKNVRDMRVSMPDGTICLGNIPDTGEELFVMPEDFSCGISFDQAAKCLAFANKEKKPYGHDDWRIPTQVELQVILENKEKGLLKGTFNLTGHKKGTNQTPSSFAGWYWSSDTTAESEVAGSQDFSDGTQNKTVKETPLSVRCVRSVKV